jgi:PadR family transcriptional regulator PadR
VVVVSRNQFLGEFEQLVLLAIARCGRDAYGVSIRRELETRVGERVSIGSVYAAVDRMERKGYIASTIGDPTPTRGGRAKRFYRLEEAGREAVLRAKDRMDRFWDGLKFGAGTEG